MSISTGSSALSAIDTGTTLIGGPTNDVNAIWAAAGGQAIPSTPGFYEFRKFSRVSHLLFIYLLRTLVACTTNVNVSMSFGGKSWPIDPRDMSLGPVSTGSSQCLGAIFDLSMGSNIPSGGSNPSWVVGATFLVSFDSPRLASVHLTTIHGRKMYTLCIDLTLHRSGLPSCLL